MKGLLVSVVAWIALTVGVVAGVDQAIESVARDVTVNRPAPMSPGEVRTQLRLRAGTTTTTAGGENRQGPGPAGGRTTGSTGKGGVAETGPG